MKRVLIVYHHFALYRLPIIRKLMNAPGYEFTLISASSSCDGNRTIDPELAKLPVADGGIRWEFVKNVWLGGAKSPFLWQKGLLQRLDQGDYDTVIFLGSMYYLTTWLGISSAKKQGKRVILWTHGFLGKDSGWRAWIRHRFYRSADACLLYGNRGRGIMLEANHYDPEQLYIVYNSLDYELHCRMRDCSLPERRMKGKIRLFGSSDCAVIGYIGRLAEGKSLDLLIEAIAEAKKLGSVYKVLLIGNGPMRDVLETLAIEAGVADDILFYGYCDGEEACRILASSDVCVVPGSVGLTAMHAMSLGVPVVTHHDVDVQKPEFEAIVEGKTGLCFERGNAKDLTRKLMELNDPERLLSMRESCFKVIDSFYNPSFQCDVICKAVDGESAGAGGSGPAELFD